MFRKHRRHYGSIALSSGVVLLYFILLTHTQTQTTSTESVAREKTGTSRPVGSRYSTEPERLRVFQTSDFYRTIVDNNLFHPLGWRPPRPREPYRLIGTLIPTDGNRTPQAIMQNIATKQNHIVTLGDTLDTDTIVTDIQPKQVTLSKTGIQRTFTLDTHTWIK